MSASFVVLVDFKLVARETMAEFRLLVDDNARQSCALEPGCRRFDVLIPTGTDNQLWLYEIYDDRAAFEAHLRMPHYHSFDAESAGLVKTKTVREFALVCEGSNSKTSLGVEQS